MRLITAESGELALEKIALPFYTPEDRWLRSIYNG
jgi:hypothetical protein